jgi:HK97 family phage major capsid protein
MEKVLELIEKQGKAFEAFRAANDSRLAQIEGKGHADPLLEEKVDRVNADITAITKQLAELEKKAGRIGDPMGGKEAKSEHAKAFELFFRKGTDNGLAELQAKALSGLIDPDGGYTVPEELDAAIDRVATTVSAMRRLATVRAISTSTYKKLVSQGGAASGWVGEKTARAETNTPTLSEIAINTKELYANPAATQTLLDDSAVNIAAWLADEVSIEFAAQENAAFVSGNGVEKPRGILGYDTITNASYAWGKIGFVPSGASSTFPDPDKLITLQHALKSVYRNGAAWMMNDAVQAYVRTFKDGEGNYLWRPGLEPGAPNTLLGKPVETDDNMPAITTNTFPIAFGNFRRGYLIVDRIGTRILRDPYTAKPYVMFYTTKRVGGGVVNFEAIKLLKVAAS